MIWLIDDKKRKIYNKNKNFKLIWQFIFIHFNFRAAGKIKASWLFDFRFTGSDSHEKILQIYFPAI